jgi:hypothetical protein
MAQTNFTAADMYPKAAIAKAAHAAPAPVAKKAKKNAEPVVEESAVDSE